MRYSLKSTQARTRVDVADVLLFITKTSPGFRGNPGNRAGFTGLPDPINFRGRQALIAGSLAADRPKEPVVWWLANLQAGKL